VGRPLALIAVPILMQVCFNVLVEVPVMLSVCSVCNRTRHWFPEAA
jgi:ACR3 family arsenite efflux pump ArsB